MNISHEYISAVVLILVTILPKFGITIGSDELTALLQAIITIAGSAWIMYRRFQKGDISLLGAKKY